MAGASWAFDGMTLEIDWGRYGQYVLKQTQGNELAGGARKDLSNWRKASFKRAFSPTEERLIAGDHGTKEEAPEVEMA